MNHVELDSAIMDAQNDMFLLRLVIEAVGDKENEARMMKRRDGDGRLLVEIPDELSNALKHAEIRVSDALAAVEREFRGKPAC